MLHTIVRSTMMASGITKRHRANNGYSYNMTCYSLNIIEYYVILTVDRLSTVQALKTDSLGNLLASVHIQSSIR